MSVYLPKDCKTWRYRFTWKGKLYVGSTGQLTEADAKLVDAQEQLRVRQEAHGIAPFQPDRTPRFSDWAEVYYKDVVTRRRDRVKRPERIDDLLRCVLRFWGAKPAKPAPRDVGPYRNLRLIDPLVEPQLILQFEEWMAARGIAGQTKNQYRSTLSQMYKLALAPAWRKVTGIEQNPFRDIDRDPKVTRTATSSLEDLRKILAVAPYHIRLAISIGLLAHKLRLENILQLTWSDHILELGPRTLPGGLVVYGWIKVSDHKTDRATGRPLVAAIPKQLYEILLDARARNQRSSTPSRYVVNYRGKPIKDLHNGLHRVCTRAGVPYGRFTPNGITFHTLRHTASTAMVELDIPRDKRRQASGHTSDAAQDVYEHMSPIQELVPRELLSDTFPIADLVTATARVLTVPDLKADRPAESCTEQSQEIAQNSTNRVTFRIAARSST